MRVIMSEASGRLKALYGNIQDPLASYIEHKAEAIEAEESVCFKVFDKRKSVHYAEDYRSETEMEDMQAVGENGAYPVTGYEEGYNKAIRNTTYKNSFGVSREMMDDNLLTSLGKKPDKLLRSYYRGRCRELAAAIGHALQGNTTYTINGWTHSTVGADGKCVFATDHAPKVTGENQCNVWTNAFSEQALWDGITKMQNLKDEDGNTLNIQPDTIIIPNCNAAQKLAIIKAVTSVQEAASANNASNPIFGKLEIITWGYLNDYLGSLTAPWILFDSKYNKENDGNIYQDRVELEITSEMGNNDENLWKAYARYGYGFVDFRQMMAFGVARGNTMS